MIDWQPMDTAPKDGTRVLLFFPELDQDVRVGCWESVERIVNGAVTYKSEGWQHGVFSFAGQVDPTHWAPTNRPSGLPGG